jgi:hypothetical protein
MGDALTMSWGGTFGNSVRKMPDRRGKLQREERQLRNSPQ